MITAPEVNNNLSTYNLDYSQSPDGSIYTVRYNTNSWNDSSGNQYPAGISFTRFVNGSVDWVRSVNTTASVVVGYFYTAYEYSKLYSDEYGVTLLVATSANNFTYGSSTVQTYGSSTCIISFDSNGNLNGLESIDTISSNRNYEHSQLTVQFIWRGIIQTSGMIHLEINILQDYPSLNLLTGL